MSYRSKKTFAARGGDPFASENQQLPSASNSTHKPKPPMPLLDGTANKWGPFNPPTPRPSETFGYLSEPINMSMAAKNITTFTLSPSMKASQSSMQQNHQVKTSNEQPKLSHKSQNMSQQSTPLTSKVAQQQRKDYGRLLASHEQHRSMAEYSASTTRGPKQQQKASSVSLQQKEAVVQKAYSASLQQKEAVVSQKEKEVHMPHKRTHQPLNSPLIGTKPPSEKRIATGPMTGASKPPMPQTSPTLLEKMVVDKTQNGNLNDSESVLPFQSNGCEPHIERSPQHFENESWSNPNLECSSTESEGLNKGVGTNSSSKKVVSSRPRRRTVVPDWPENVKFDEKDEAIAFDANGKRHLVKGPVQPRDVWNDEGLRYYVPFNDLNQPLRKGGSILVSFLRDVAKREKFCPVGLTSWHKLKEKMKVDIVILVRKHFVIPDGQVINKAILKRTSKYWKNYRYSLREAHFNPKRRTKDQTYEIRPDGVNVQNWTTLVDYWFSEDFKKLSKIGKVARASLGHVHHSGATSFANRRVDLQEKNGKFSELDFYKSVYTKQDGSFKEGTLSEQFLADANDKVKENLASSSSTKSKVDIENEVFNDLMYNGEVPQRPLNYGFGVKQSDVFGVQGLLRERTEGSSIVSHSMVEVESLKNELSTVKKQNEHLNQKNQALEIKFDETAHTFKAIASHLAQVLMEVRNGNSSAQLIDGAESALNLISSQIPGQNDKS